MFAQLVEEGGAVLVGVTTPFFNLIRRTIVRSVPAVYIGIEGRGFVERASVAASGFRVVVRTILLEYLGAARIRARQTLARGIRAGGAIQPGGGVVGDDGDHLVVDLAHVAVAERSPGVVGAIECGLRAREIRDSKLMFQIVPAEMA